MARTRKHGQRFYCIDCRNEGYPTPNIPVRPHYHVMAGTVGCMPDGADVFATKRDAERYAVDEARDYRDAGYLVTGNVKTGYAIDPINYLEVVRCTYPECTEANEGE